MNYNSFNSLELKQLCKLIYYASTVLQKGAESTHIRIVHILEECEDTAIIELLLLMYCLLTTDIAGARFSNVQYNCMRFDTICIRMLDI